MGQLWLAKGLISLLRLPQLTSLERQRPSETFRLHHPADWTKRLGALACFVVGCGGETEIKDPALVKLRFEKTLRFLFFVFFSFFSKHST